MGNVLTTAENYLEGVLTHPNQLFSLTGLSSTLKSFAQQALSGPALATMARDFLSSDLASILEKSVEKLFPQLAPGLRIAAAITIGYDHDKTKWLQQALNQILRAKLDVDGVYGEATRDAVEQFQVQTFAEFGLKPDGWAYRLTNSAIQLVLNRVFVKDPTAATSQTPQLAPPQAAAPA